jgi:hypothetical protein
MTTAIARWHDYMHQPSAEALNALLADEAVFESPVVHTPQRGKDITFKYLWSAAKVLGNDSFTYLGEWHAERSAILEFECVVEGITINGIDMIWWNDDQLITRFKVMVRPLKAVNMLHAMMGAQLAAV